MAGEYGIITVTTSGSTVAGPSGPIGSVFQITAHPDNTDAVWIGPKNAGFPLRPGASAIRYCSTLSGLLFDADVSGEKICYLVVR